MIVKKNILIPDRNVTIPADVPPIHRNKFIQNYNAITHNTGRLLLFAYDQKIEHLNTDFYGPNIHPDALDPRHPFEITRQGRVGALATHLGLITRYAAQYPSINYVVKLNGKTNLIKTEQSDPYSAYLTSVGQVAQLIRTTNIPIKAIGFTIYLASEYEHNMMRDAAHAIFEAHQHGLITIVWIYPRGHAISNETDPILIAGAAGVGHALGADFVKIKPPQAPSNQKKPNTQPDQNSFPSSHSLANPKIQTNIDSQTSAEYLKIATHAAGNTGVICAGGSLRDPKQMLMLIYDQLHIGDAAGCAIGRNIFQHSTPDAIQITNAIASIVLDGSDIKTAYNLLPLFSYNRK